MTIEYVLFVMLFIWAFTVGIWALAKTYDQVAKLEQYVSKLDEAVLALHKEMQNIPQKWQLAKIPTSVGFDDETEAIIAEIRKARAQNLSDILKKEDSFLYFSEG